MKDNIANVEEYLDLSHDSKKDKSNRKVSFYNRKVTNANSKNQSMDAAEIVAELNENVAVEGIYIPKNNITEFDDKEKYEVEMERHLFREKELKILNEEKRKIAHKKKIEELRIKEEILFAENEIQRKKEEKITEDFKKAQELKLKLENEPKKVTKEAIVSNIN